MNNKGNRLISNEWDKELGFKIKHLDYIFMACLGILISFDPTLQAQGKEEIREPLRIIENASVYISQSLADSSLRMIELPGNIPNLTLDLRYATKENFVKRRMYPAKTRHTFLRLPAARALAAAQQSFAKKGWAIIVYDAYRPYSVTVDFWNLVKDERYVANPAKGSGHNRGLAIDISLYDLKTGLELTMPTGFDNFTDSAHHDFMKLPDDVLLHRRILKETMEKCGFQSFETEWWHYSLPGAGHFPVMDLSFKELEKANRRLPRLVK